MAEKDIFTRTARSPEDQGVMKLRRRIVFGMTGLETGEGVQIGALEKNSIVLRTNVTIITAFDAGTTNSLDVGTAADQDAYAAAAGTAAGVAGYKPNLVGALSGQRTATDDLPVYVLYTQAGTAATEGEADVIVEFITSRDEDPRDANPLL